MNTTRTMLVLAAAFGLMAGPIAWAQQSDVSGQIEELKQGQQELKGEVSGLKEEMAALKGELEKLRGELTRTTAALKAVQRQGQRRQAPAMTMVGKAAPEFAVTTIDGEQTKIGGKRETPQVMFCYASWCGYCKRALPGIEKLHQNYKDKGVEVLALNLDARGEGGRAKTEEETLKTYQDLNLTIPMTMTTSGNDTQKIGAAYKARSFPTLFVLGSSGEVESVHVGAKPGLETIVGKELDLLLEGKTRADFPKQ